MNWEPSPSDIEWTKNLLRIIREGGSWAQPASGATFSFFHSRKKFAVKKGFSSPLGDDMIARTKKVLHILGWEEAADVLDPSLN